MCEISGMCFSIVAALLTNNSHQLSWGEVGSQVVFALITGVVGGFAGLIVKLIWNKAHQRREKRGKAQADRLREEN